MNYLAPDVTNSHVPKPCGAADAKAAWLWQLSEQLIQ